MRAPTKADHRTILDRELIPACVKPVIAHGMARYRGIFGEKCPKFRYEIFTQKAKDDLTWAGVQERKINITSFISYPIKPLLLINLVLIHPQVPRYVFMATFIEEMVHLKMGFDLMKPHGGEYLELMDRCREFRIAQEWKKQNLKRAIELSNVDHSQQFNTDWGLQRVV